MLLRSPKVTHIVELCTPKNKWNTIHTDEDIERFPFTEVHARGGTKKPFYPI